MSSATSDVTKDDCSICLQTLTTGLPLLTLSCGHKFHLQCLALNVKVQNKECPLCRSTIETSLSQLLTGFNNNSQQQQPPLNFIPPRPIYVTAHPPTETVENVSNRMPSSPSEISFYWKSKLIN
jgi:hypothetical protein